MHREHPRYTSMDRIHTRDNTTKTDRRNIRQRKGLEGGRISKAEALSAFNEEKGERRYISNLSKNTKAEEGIIRDLDILNIGSES